MKEELEANPSAAGGGRYKIARDPDRSVIDVCFCLRQVGSSEVIDPINPARTVLIIYVYFFTQNLRKELSELM